VRIAGSGHVDTHWQLPPAMRCGRFVTLEETAFLKGTQAFEFKSFSFSPTHVDYLSKVTVAIASILSYFLSRGFARSVAALRFSLTRPIESRVAQTFIGLSWSIQFRTLSLFRR